MALVFMLNNIKQPLRMTPRLNMIVAAGADGSIGRRGDLIWHISGDLRRFKQLTMGHPVIMGRKTWESLPKRPLPGRLNIVVTRNPAYFAPGAEVAVSPEEALKTAAAMQPGDTPFLMGGAELYCTMLPQTDRIYLTRVHAECPDADAWLPWPLPENDWTVAEASEPETTPEGVVYDYVTLQRKSHDKA